MRKRRSSSNTCGTSAISNVAPPFFIVGSARSGTTLLRLMLNAHPEVAVPPESRFITEFHGTPASASAELFVAALAKHKMFATWDLPIAAVEAEIRELGAEPTYPDLVAATFRAYARTHGKTIWGDKTPRYVQRIDLISTLWPDARFIHLIRDGRDVALSYADVRFGPKTVGSAARLWATRVRAGRVAGRALPPGRYLEVRYEDLVEDAAGKVKEICGFLDLEFDAAMLDYTERARDSVLPRAALYNPNVTRPPARTRAWQTSMAPRAVAAFEAVAGDVLADLGYERRYPSPPLSAALVGRLGALSLPVGRLSSGSATKMSRRRDSGDPGSDPPRP